MTAGLARACGVSQLTRVHEGRWFDIHRAVERGTGRIAAIKSLRPEIRDRAAIRRLDTEARLRTTVIDPGVLPAWRVVRQRGVFAIVGPWFADGTLASRTAPLVRDQLAGIVGDAASALDAIHAAGFVHGDVHRRNVLLAATGRAVLADLASARRIGDRGLAGYELTPLIVPPEAWQGGPLDARADVYGLGVLLYRELCGRFPFEHDAIAELARLHCEAAVPAMPGLPRGPLTRVVDDALAKDPERRIPSAGALAARLREAIAAEPDRGRAIALVRAPSAETLTAVAARMEQFAGELGPRERAALAALLAQAGAADDRSVAEAAAITTDVFAVPAALVALERSGAARALADAPATPEQLAARAGLAVRPLAAVLAALAAARLIERRGDRYALPPALVTLYRSPARTVGPIGEALSLWCWLPTLLRHGGPYLQMDRSDGSRYAGVVHVLDGLFAEPARQLAALLAPRLPRAPEVLDLGAGSGVWSLAIAVRCPGASITAVDRAAVLEQTRHHADAAGLGARLTTVCGDLGDVALDADRFDLVLLANVCHLVAPATAAHFIARAAAAARPGARIVVVDTMPASRRDGSVRVHAHDLRLQLRSPDGGIHDRAAYAGWMRAAGLTAGRITRFGGGDDGLAALVGQRRRSTSTRERASPAPARDRRR